MSGSTTQSADSGRWSFEPAHDAPMTAQRPPALWRTMQVAASTSAEVRSSSCWIARLCAGLRRHLPAGSRTELAAGRRKMGGKPSSPTLRIHFLGGPRSREPRWAAAARPRSPERFPSRIPTPLNAQLARQQSCSVAAAGRGFMLETAKTRRQTIPVAKPAQAGPSDSRRSPRGARARPGGILRGLTDYTPHWWFCLTSVIHLRRGAGYFHQTRRRCATRPSSLDQVGPQPI